MPHPAFATIIKLGVVAAAAGAVARLVRRRTPQPTAPVPVPAAPVEPEAPAVSKPSPATIAKNVAHERPHAAPVAEHASEPDDSPGGKLPPRR